MGKKFVGQAGLKRFWTKAKTWIAGQITAEVTAKIAEIVANAPEDLDTLKEIADWIKNHANDASAMNTAILANTEAISGKADKSHTHTKSEITDFDHTHDDRYYTESEVDAKLSGKSDTGHIHNELKDSTNRVLLLATNTYENKRFVKIGPFANGTTASFLLTIKRVDGLGFTGFLTINSHSVYGGQSFNGFKSEYSMYEITTGELVYLYRNSDNTNDIYIDIPSYAKMSMLLFLDYGDKDVTLKDASEFSGTLLDKF